MKIIADLHIHSKYSRATSPDMDLEELDKWAQTKGINVLGTGDFTHPAWFLNLQKKLKPAEPGLYKLKNNKSQTRFLLTSEISCIYKKPIRRGSGQDSKVRKVHLIVFAPSFETVVKINKKLSSIGNIKSDGRPILGLDAKELLKIVLDIDENCLVVPAHLWTPWFSLFGSKSGFDSIEECFDEYSKYIFAVETGLCSNPEMNWRVSSLDKVALISNSDAHSASKIGREANVFDTELSYKGIIDAIKSKEKFLYTIEFFPEQGKYHFDGHRNCKVSFSPSQSAGANNICPVCRKPLVIGVLNRVEELADRPEGFVSKNKVPFKSLIPLEEIVASSIGKTVLAKDVGIYYDKLINNLGTEFNILLDANKKEIEKFSLPEIAQGILQVREGKVKIEPGYDGVYGKIKIL
jgi:uncharacterized protein (TIGR00375 family)